jgi:thiol-disulfide isomerase/thioredoxin
VGDEAILYAAQDLMGSMVDLPAKLRGKVSLVAFWASWCQPCIEEIPRLREISRAYRHKGAIVVGVGLRQGGETAAKQRQMAGRQLVNYLLLFDGEEKHERAYHLSALPWTLLVGVDGRIAWQGAVLPPDLEARIDALLAAPAAGGPARPEPEPRAPAPSGSAGRGSAAR